MVLRLRFLKSVDLFLDDGLTKRLSACRVYAQGIRKIANVWDATPAYLCVKLTTRKYRFLVSAGVSIAVAMAKVEAEDSGPISSPTPGPTTSGMEEPALPTPDATPGDAGPILLPESDQLPATPRAEQSTKASINRLTTEPSAKERARFEEVQSRAMSNPRAAYLLKRARNSSSAAARRTYFRAYYSTVAARMRKLDPELKSSIDAYEQAKVHQVSGSAIPSNGSSRQSRSHRSPTRDPHHRSRRETAHHRRERMMIIYDPYGPYMPPPPYGPFDPW